MRPSLLLFACTSTLLLAGCPSYTSLADGTQMRIQEMRDGQLLWLKQSMYAGPFWDDDRYRLLSPFPFDRVEAVLSPEGEPLLPPAHDSIVPAGTRVRVERVVFPTGDAVFRRPLYPPRYATWVYLRVANTRGDTRLEHEQRHILLLPAHIKDISGFDTWFEAALTADDPNPWIRSLESSQRLGIEQKRAVAGMDYEALAAALGAPDRLERRPPAPPGRPTTVEVASFGQLTVTLEDGVVVRVDDPTRTAPAEQSAPDPGLRGGNVDAAPVSSSESSDTTATLGTEQAPEREVDGSFVDETAPEGAADDQSAPTSINDGMVPDQGADEPTEESARP
ncbi:MAG: hypothetical protein ACO3JL_14755 [Myxococcota bacterium]